MIQYITVESILYDCTVALYMKYVYISYIHHLYKYIYSFHCTYIMTKMQSQVVNSILIHHIINYVTCSFWCIIHTSYIYCICYIQYIHYNIHGICYIYTYTILQYTTYTTYTTYIYFYIYMYIYIVTTVELYGMDSIIAHIVLHIILNHIIWHVRYYVIDCSIHYITCFFYYMYIYTTCILHYILYIITLVQSHGMNSPVILRYYILHYIILYVIYNSIRYTIYCSIY